MLDVGGLEAAGLTCDVISVVAEFMVDVAGVEAPGRTCDPMAYFCVRSLL
jgi:hypothetical protein